MRNLELEHDNREPKYSNLKSNISILFLPNPAKDITTFSKEVKSVQVFDLKGKLIQSSIVNGTEMNVST